MRQYSRIGIGLVVLLFLGCSRVVELPAGRSVEDFFPLEIGNFWEYAVDEQLFLGVNDSEELSYFIRDKVRSSYSDGDRKVFVLERSRSDDKKAWSFELDYTLEVRNGDLVMTLHNQPILLLVYPVQDGLIWNGNKYRNFPEDLFKVIDLESSHRGNELVQVIQEDEDNLVTLRDHRFDQFEKNVGLVYRSQEVLHYCSRSDCLGDLLVESGRTFTQALIDYGKE